MAIYDAAMQYQQENRPLAIIAGKNMVQVLAEIGQLARIY